MLEYITLAISSILAIIAASLNTEKDEKGGNKTVLKKPNKVGIIVIWLLIFLTGIQFFLQSRQESEQKIALNKVKIERIKDLKDMDRLLDRTKNDSIALTYQIIQLDSQKHQMLRQIQLSNNLIETQKFAIHKTAEYNESLKQELEKQKYELLPLRLLFTIVIKGKDLIKEDGYKNLIDSILSIDDNRNNNIADISKNYDSSYNVSIANLDYIPDLFRYAQLDFGLYESITQEQIKSIGFQWDSTLLRLRFDDLNILSFRSNSSFFETNIRYETVNTGKVMNENRKIHSSLELDDLYLNIQFPYVDFEIKQIMLISGKPNEENYKRIKLKEVFAESFNPDNGKWYQIELIE